MDVVGLACETLRRFQDCFMYMCDTILISGSTCLVLDCCTLEDSTGFARLFHLSVHCNLDIWLGFVLRLQFLVTLYENLKLFHLSVHCNLESGLECCSLRGSAEITRLFNFSVHYNLDYLV